MQTNQTKAKIRAGQPTFGCFVQKGVLYHCAGDAAFLIAGAQQYLRAGKGA